ncbi:MAG: DUF58 domain-containing protein [Elusimicrobiales bacterium]|nr:DUF58 domain-containing protein [Elusimicrobiales bacterium]
MRYLDQETASRVRARAMRPLRLSGSGRAEGFHAARASHGPGQEFAEYRAYSEGDPVRSIDWKLYARSDRYYLRRFSREESIRFEILADASASMSFAGPGAVLSKWEYSCRFAMALACLCLYRRDPCGLAFLPSGSGPGVPQGSGAGHLARLDAAFSSVKPAGRWDGLEGLAPGAAGGKRPSVFFFSDLLCGRAELEASARELTARAGKCFVLHLLDPGEDGFPWRGETVFSGLEEEGSVSAAADDLEGAYRAAAARRRALCAGLFSSPRLSYFPLRTDLPLFRNLDRFLAGWLK